MAHNVGFLEFVKWKFDVMYGYTFDSTPFFGAIFNNESTILNYLFPVNNLF